MLDSASDAAAARKDLAHIFSTGPIDSVDQWEALSSGGGAKDGPRKEVLLHRGQVTIPPMLQTKT